MVLFNNVFFAVLIVLSILANGSLAQATDSATGCLRGPNFWCLNDTTEGLCNFTDKAIGLCGYTSKRCQIKTGDAFCKSSPPAQQQSALKFNGGLTGVDENLFAYYILSLYWPPSSCPRIYNETNELLSYFCSPYTNVDQPGSERLALHGLWPTFSTDGNYQGWPQFCSSKPTDWSTCHIDGNLCPWKNTTRSDFTQAHYEYCLASEGIQSCLVNGSEILEPERERLKIFAPGYLNRYNLFINHEWTKHGSCCASSFGYNISVYLTYTLDLIDLVTRSDSLTYQYIQRYAGEKIGLTYLLSALNQTAIVNCNSKCELEELWMCMDRDEQTGLPNNLITCPEGARNVSDSCRKARCDYVSIPRRTARRQEQTVSDALINIWNKLLGLVVLLVIIKLVFCCFAVVSSFFLNNDR